MPQQHPLTGPSPLRLALHRFTIVDDGEVTAEPPRAEALLPDQAILEGEMRSFFVFLILLTSTLASPGQRAIVVAVDTSRSLKAAELEEITSRLRDDLAALPAGIPVGLIAFDDSARWIAEPGEGNGAVAGLGTLKPQGRFTVLNDALFLAARRLENGGIIVLVSDGRDENSAVEVGDIRELCRENGVAIVTLAAGHRMDERALRRLALLSGGRFLGRLDELETGDFAASIGEILSAQRRLAPTPAPTPGSLQASDTEVSPRTTAAPEAGNTGRAAGTGLLLLLLAALFGLVLVTVFLLRRKADSGQLCPHCASPMEDGVCPLCMEMEAVEEAARTNRVAVSAAPGPPLPDPDALARDTLPGNLDRTMSLGEVAILTVREEGTSERSFNLPRDSVFAVGRAPGVNTLVMNDPTISSQHFKIVCRDGVYYVVDLGTTNGTLIDSERVRVRRLSPGDVIRAGMTDFVFSYYGQRLPEEDASV